MDLADVEALAARLLGGERTKLGGLEIAHARRVAAGLLPTGDSRAVAAALLHDVLEKSETTAAQLRELTGDAELVAIVEVLTRRADESEWDYLGRCAAHPVARTVKRLDLGDKLTADDNRVPAEVAERLRRVARRRLALLDRLALRHDP